MVGLEAMELANSTLEDFVSTKNYWVVFSHTVLNHYLFVLQVLMFIGYIINFKDDGINE